MAHATYKRQGWKTPIELRAHRGGLIAFGGLALVLLLVGRAELPFLDSVRMTAADLASADKRNLRSCHGWNPLWVW